MGHTLCEAQVLQASEGRQSRYHQALYRLRRFIVDQIAERPQHHIPPEMRRCCIACIVHQHLQLGTVAHCMQPHRAYVKLLGTTLCLMWGKSTI